MSDGFRLPTRREAMLLGGVTLTAALAVVMLPSLVNGSTFPAVCEQTLGPEWDTVGVIDAPGLDHYDVRCERSTGLFSTETRFVSVPRSEYEFPTGWEQTKRFYRGVLGL